jgi:hypothetical protein
MAMMTTYRITNIHPPAVDHERITHVYVQELARWLTTEEAIGYLRSKACAFFVLGARGEKVYVGIFEAVGRRTCLRTYADHTWTDNLRALPGGRQAA